MDLQVCDNSPCSLKKLIKQKKQELSELIQGTLTLQSFFTNELESMHQTEIMLKSIITKSDNETQALKSEIQDLIDYIQIHSYSESQLLTLQQSSKSLSDYHTKFLKENTYEKIKLQKKIMAIKNEIEDLTSEVATLKLEHSSLRYRKTILENQITQLIKLGPGNYKWIHSRQDRRELLNQRSKSSLKMFLLSEANKKVFLKN
ncbi:hypothetical protein SteCoe_17845 [Stentor coeruleus]|uniref:Uncharacterized protein n=1 Tax=Stentor coeruleus TaxID=5963 RepID=A0A1R2BXZ4_9CILI|nr:hypothetical protein SteCoe_17845 [Stentor coeruleus]